MDYVLVAYATLLKTGRSVELDEKMGMGEYFIRDESVLKSDNESRLSCELSIIDRYIKNFYVKILSISSPCNII